MIKLREIDGLPVVDAKSPITLHITADHVKRASRKRPNSCAIAQTCLARPGVKEVRIHLSRAYIRSGLANWKRFFVSKTLRSEIIAFDRGGRFSPGDYILHVATKSHKLGAMRGGESGQTKPHETRGKNKRRSPHIVTDVRTGPA